MSASYPTGRRGIHIAFSYLRTAKERAPAREDFLIHDEAKAMIAFSLAKPPDCSQALARRLCHSVMNALFLKLSGDNQLGNSRWKELGDRR
jgi:hypothetical protein